MNVEFSKASDFYSYDFLRPDANGAQKLLDRWLRRLPSAFAPAADEASLLIRATMDTNPFERWGVKCLFSPSRASTDFSSMASISPAFLPE